MHLDLQLAAREESPATPSATIWQKSQLLARIAQYLQWAVPLMVWVPVVWQDEGLLLPLSITPVLALLVVQGLRGQLSLQYGQMLWWFASALGLALVTSFSGAFYELSLTWWSVWLVGSLALLLPEALLPSDAAGQSVLTGGAVLGLLLSVVFPGWGISTELLSIFCGFMAVGILFSRFHSQSFVLLLLLLWGTVQSGNGPFGLLVLLAYMSSGLWSDRRFSEPERRDILLLAGYMLFLLLWYSWQGVMSWSLTPSGPSVLDVPTLLLGHGLGTYVPQALSSIDVMTFEGGIVGMAVLVGWCGAGLWAQRTGSQYLWTVLLLGAVLISGVFLSTTTGLVLFLLLASSRRRALQ